MTLSSQDRGQLLALAHKAIRYGCEHQDAFAPPARAWPSALVRKAASFVTLHKHGQLRGCVGSLAVRRTLVADVVHNAQAAAFRDPRFPPVTNSELELLELHISVLSPTAFIEAETESDLLAQLRPGVDGLVLEDGRHTSTFLPSVWASLPDKKAFLMQLKLKAGLAEDYWSDSLKTYRYTTEEFSSTTK